MAAETFIIGAFRFGGGMTPRAKNTKAKRKADAPIRSVGRPTTYNPETHPDRAMNYALLGMSDVEIAAAFGDRAMNYALLGMSDVEIAAAFGIDAATLYRWQSRYPEFRESSLAGKAEADSRVVRSLYERARGMVVPAVKVVARQDREAEIVRYDEYLPPDVNAARLWLFNRRPREWRDRKEIEVSGGIEHRVMAMTQEERMARLQALLEKAGQVIEGEAVEVAAAEDTGDDQALPD